MAKSRSFCGIKNHLQMDAFGRLHARSRKKEVSFWHMPTMVKKFGEKVDSITGVGIKKDWV